MSVCVCGGVWWLTLHVGAEVGGAAVAPVAGHGAGAHLHHVGRPGLQALDAGRAALGRHGVGDGLALVLWDRTHKRETLSAMAPSDGTQTSTHLKHQYDTIERERERERERDEII